MTVEIWLLHLQPLMNSSFHFSRIMELATFPNETNTITFISDVRCVGLHWRAEG